MFFPHPSQGAASKSQTDTWGLEMILCANQGFPRHASALPLPEEAAGLGLTCTFLSSLSGLQNKLLELNSERCR